LAIPALVLAAFVVAATSIVSPEFLTPGNLGNIANRLLPLALATLGASIVIISGGIDLSVGSVMSLVTAIMATLASQIGWFTIPVALAIGAAIGLANAGGILLLRINPLIMTLASATIVKGATLLILPRPGGEVDYAFYDWLFGSDALLAPPFWIIVLAYAAGILLLGWTRSGRALYALGSDPRAAFASGIAVGRITVLVYVIAGMLSAAAGIVLSIRILSGDPLVGEPYTLDAIAAAILGGIALKGGRGSVLGALFAALVLVLLNNAMNLLDIDTNFQAIAKGLVFVTALIVFTRGRRLAETD
jgi:ribose transport system permease protein